MGGHIGSVPGAAPGLYQGGLSECGLVDGIGIADYLMAYTAAAELISGVPILDAPDRQAFGPLLEGLVRALGLPGSYTERGRQFDSVVKYLMGADRVGNDLPLRLQGFAARYLPNIMHRPKDVENDPIRGLRASHRPHQYRSPVRPQERSLPQRIGGSPREGAPFADAPPCTRIGREAHVAAPHAARDRTLGCR